MKTVLSYVLIVASVFYVSAQDLSQPLPVDQSIKKGVLPNGMTYYIKSTDVVKDAASYYIIQNVGSVLENENQRGLAHFLEHMAFNGTEHFPGKGIFTVSGGIPGHPGICPGAAPGGVAGLWHGIQGVHGLDHYFFPHLCEPPGRI